MGTTLSVIGQSLLDAIRTPPAPPTLAGGGDQPRQSAFLNIPNIRQFSTDFGPVGNAVAQPESRNRNIREDVDGLPTGPASGYFQIEDDTWKRYAPGSQWATAMDAPPQAQWTVAQRIPLREWAPSTVQVVLREFPWARPDMTLGQMNAIATQNGGLQQRYIPSSQNPEFNARDAPEWFRPPTGGYERGPGNLPGAFDVPPLMRAAAIAIPILSLFSRGAAVPMLTAWGAYAEGYQTGQLLKQKVQANYWQNHLKETVARMEEEGIQYGDAFQAYGDNPAGLANALNGIATRYGDNAMQAALQQGGPAAAYNLMQKRDSQYTDLNKLKDAHDLHELQRLRLTEQIERDRRREVETREREQRAGQAAATLEELRRAQIEEKRAKDAKDKQKEDTARKKREQLEETLKRLGVPQSSIPSATDTAEEDSPEDSTGTAGSTDLEETPPEDTTTPDQSGARETPKAPTRADQGDTATPSPSRTGAAEPPIDQPYQEASLTPTGAPSTQQRPTVVPPVQQVAQVKPVDTWAGQLLRGGEPATLQGVPKEAMPYIQELAAQKRAQLDQIIADPDLPPDQVIPRVRKIDQGTADTLQGMIDRRVGIPATGGFGARLQEFWTNMGNLARKADPTWDAGQWQQIQEFRNPNGQTQRALGRVAALAKTAALVLQDLKELPDDKNAFARAVSAWKAGALEGSSIYTNLFSDWQAFAIESNTIRTGGTGSVTETEQLIRTIPYYGSKEQFRGAVKRDSITAFARIDHWRTQWRQLGRKDEMAGDEPEATRTLRWISTLDDRSGRMKGPGDVPEDLAPAMPQDIKAFDPDKAVH